MTDPVRDAMNRCYECNAKGTTRTVFRSNILSWGDSTPIETRICRTCWNRLRNWRIKCGYDPGAEWEAPETNYDPHKGEPGTI